MPQEGKPKKQGKSDRADDGGGKKGKDAKKKDKKIRATVEINGPDAASFAPPARNARCGPRYRRL